VRDVDRPSSASSSDPATAVELPAAREPLDLVGLEPPTWRDRLAVLRDFGAAQLTVAALVVGVAVGAVWFLTRPREPAVETVIPMASSTVEPAGGGPSTTLPSSVFVHAAGAVTAPGLYELPAGSRIADLLQAAGGEAVDADLDRLNLAAPLTDGARVFVPRVGEPDVPAVAGPAADVGGEPSTALVPLNTAATDELETLPGVGPATAAAIIEHRTARGPFEVVEDLLEVRGIGEAKLAQLRDLVVVG
jgi:competence protein ComEA